MNNYTLKNHEHFLHSHLFFFCRKHKWHEKTTNLCALVGTAGNDQLLLTDVTM